MHTATLPHNPPPADLPLQLVSEPAKCPGRSGASCEPDPWPEAAWVPRTPGSRRTTKGGVAGRPEVISCARDARRSVWTSAAVRQSATARRPPRGHKGWTKQRRQPQGLLRGRVENSGGREISRKRTSVKASGAARQKRRQRQEPSTCDDKAREKPREKVSERPEMTQGARRHQGVGRRLTRVIFPRRVIRPDRAT